MPSTIGSSRPASVMIPKYRIAKMNMPAIGATSRTPSTMNVPVLKPKPPIKDATVGTAMSATNGDILLLSTAARSARIVIRPSVACIDWFVSIPGHTERAGWTAILQEHVAGFCFGDDAVMVLAQKESRVDQGIDRHPDRRDVARVVAIPLLQGKAAVPGRDPRSLGGMERDESPEQSSQITDLRIGVVVIWEVCSQGSPVPDRLDAGDLVAIAVHGGNQDRVISAQVRWRKPVSDTRLIRLVKPRAEVEQAEPIVPAPVAELGNGLPLTARGEEDALHGRIPEIFGTDEGAVSDPRHAAIWRRSTIDYPRLQPHPERAHDIVKLGPDPRRVDCGRWVPSRRAGEVLGSCEIVNAEVVRLLEVLCPVRVTEGRRALQDPEFRAAEGEKGLWAGLRRRASTEDAAGVLANIIAKTRRKSPGRTLAEGPVLGA